MSFPADCTESPRLRLTDNLAKLSMFRSVMLGGPGLAESYQRASDQAHPWQEPMAGRGDASVLSGRSRARVLV